MTVQHDCFRFGYFGAALLMALALGSLACQSSANGRTTIRVIAGRAQASRYVSPSAYQHYLAARLELARGNGRLAIHHLRAALLFDDESPYLHTELARVYARRGKTKRAQGELARALALQPHYPDALLLAGDLARRLPARAEAMYRRCAASNPRYEPCQLRLANSLEARGKTAAARKVLVTLSARKKASASAHRRLALLCLRTLDLACAQRAYEKALQQRTSLRTLLQLALVARGAGDLPRATRRLREVFDRSGGDIRAARELLAVLGQAGKRRAVDDLVTVLEKQARTSPMQAAALAQLMLAAKRPRRALALAQRQIAAGDKRPELALVRGLALAKLKRKAAARGALRAVLTSAQGAWAAIELARSWRASKSARAISVLEKALRRQPTNAALVRALSAQLFGAGQPRRSLQITAKALAKKPGDFQLRFDHATALQRAGRWKDAIDLMQAIDLTHAINLKKRRPKAQAHNAAAQNFIGFTLAEHGQDLPRAERAIRRALYLDPGRAYVIDSLGWLLFRKQQLAESRRVLEIASRLAPDEAEIAAHLGEVNAALKRLPEAIKLYQKAIAKADAPWDKSRWRKRLRRLSAGRLGTR